MQTTIEAGVQKEVFFRLDGSPSNLCPAFLLPDDATTHTGEEVDLNSMEVV